MGMFDNLRCHYPLPVEGANALLYQTKDTDAQFLDLYEIREDGTLWHEEYDIEDRSEAHLWQVAHPGEALPDHLKGLAALAGMCTTVNKRWVPDAFDGCIRFGTFADHHPDRGWIEWSAVCVRGRMVHGPELVEHTPAEAP